MKLMKTLTAGAAAIALTTAFATVATPVLAQSTTSDVRGVVTDPSGAPVSGAAVTVTDELTGTTRTVTTGSNGSYAVRGLNPAGVYTVRVSSARFASEAVTDLRISVGDSATVNFDLEGVVSSDEIVVIASRANVIEVATGPSATFGFSDIQDSPAINRDIKDIIRQDPRLFIEQSNGDGLQCAGASPRFNSLTVDGIRLNDNFGLNSNGFPTERIPFPFDAIDQVAVEFSPFDVEYGGFTACNINAVTRSGSNEFHGSAWGDYTNDSLRGGVIEGDSFDKGDFREVRFGATLSGPIIKDKLFFFAAYENLNGNEVITRGPAEAGSIGVQGVTQAQLDRIAQIARDVYGYDVLDIPASFPEDDEKILAKLDWNITDDHRATFTFNRNNGNNITASDDDPDEYEFFDHYYLRSTKLTSYSGQVFSNWTDRLSTELRVSYTVNDTGQNSINGTDFGEFQIDTYNPATDQTATVYLGADDSRHSNKLDTKTFNIKFNADYVVNNHLFTIGFEREQVDIFNLFIQHSQGQYDFDAFSTRFNALIDNPDANIDAFEQGLADDIFYGNAGFTNNPDDGAAEFKFATNSIYLQDKISFDQWGLTVTAGLRYDFYTSGDTPAENPGFVARNGFSNTETFDGRGLLQPRLGVNWEAANNLSFRAGLGIFSGGNPNVWLSNSYQNDGITTVQVELDDQDLNDLVFVNGENGQNTPGFGVPQILFDQVANPGSALTAVNAVDPDFDIPSQWKVSGGMTYDFDMPLGLGEGYSFRADYQFTKDREAASVIDATIVQTGTASDGRPLFSRVDFSDPDCQVNPASADCDSRDGDGQDFILTNNEGGRSHVFSAALSKDYEFGGVFADWTLGYAYVDATDRNPMTSSVAFSNFVNFSASNVNNPSPATSNYVVPHRITLTAGARKAFFGDYETKFRLFGTISQSRPFSFIFNDNFGFHQRLGDRGFIERQLVYVPTGADDPNVTFADDFNGAETAAERDAEIAAFFATLDELGLSEHAGEISPRNGFQSDWFSQWDLRIEQEIPGLFKTDKGSMFVVVENIGNLLNSDWGVINQAGFPGAVRLIDADLDGDQLVYEGFRNLTRESIQSPVTNASVWEIRFGVRYEF